MICTFKKKLAKVLCGVLVFTQLGTMQAFARPDWHLPWQMGQVL